MTSPQIKFLYLNIGHFLDHLFMLIFASVAALALTHEWQMSYSELIPYATPGFIAFALGALLAGWLADKWSRERMMVIFFIGIGFSSVLASFTDSPYQIALSLTLVGLFASIYHPVGLAMVVEGRAKTGMPLAINGVFGNLGVGSAVLISGLFIDTFGWRSAFLIPGLFSMFTGLTYWWFISSDSSKTHEVVKVESNAEHLSETASKQFLMKVFAIVLFTTALGGLVFQSTTFTLPKVFDELLAVSASEIGWYAFFVFSIAAFAQVIVGHLVDKYSVRIVFSIVALMQGVFLGLMTQAEGFYAVLIAIAFMLFVFGQVPINDVLVGKVAKSEWRSRAYSIRYIISFTVTASAVPFIAWVHSNGGFNLLFSILSLTAFLVLIATLFLPKKL